MRLFLKLLGISGILSFAYEQPPLLELFGYSLLVFVLIVFASVQWEIYKERHLK